MTNITFEYITSHKDLCESCKHLVPYHKPNYSYGYKCELLNDDSNMNVTVITCTGYELNEDHNLKQD